MNARRKAALGAALPFLLTGCVMLVLAACSKTQFEREHAAALKDNPWGVEFEIRAEGNRTKFHPGDTLRFQEFYTAKSPRMWQLEVLESSNAADAANVAFVSDGSSTQQFSYAATKPEADKWRFVVLDTDPVRVPYYNATATFHTLTLPRQPGKYEIYVQTHRLVLRKGGGLDPVTHTGYPLTSKLLKVEVVGDELAQTGTANRVH